MTQVPTNPSGSHGRATPVAAARRRNTRRNTRRSARHRAGGRASTGWSGGWSCWRAGSPGAAGRGARRSPAWPPRHWPAPPTPSQGRCSRVCIFIPRPSRKGVSWTSTPRSTRSSRSSSPRSCPQCGPSAGVRRRHRGGRGAGPQGGGGVRRQAAGEKGPAARRGPAGGVPSRGGVRSGVRWRATASASVWTSLARVHPPPLSVPHASSLRRPTHHRRRRRDLRQLLLNLPALDAGLREIGTGRAEEAKADPALSEALGGRTGGGDHGGRASAALSGGGRRRPATAGDGRRWPTMARSVEGMTDGGIIGGGLQ